MTITITIEAANGTEARRKMTELLGGTAAPISERLVAAVGEEKATELTLSNKSDTELADIADGRAAPETTATRKRGEPSPGKARRTKAEIAEDDAADAADAKGNEGWTGKVIEANISSGAEDRADPENPEDAAQDAADEAAEAATVGDDLTVDDVKALAVTYQETYGVAAVQEDGAKIFVEALGTPPDGEKYWKFSILPTDQASLQKLQTVWQRAIDENPLKRAKV